jgi:hypothetical protein
MKKTLRTLLLLLCINTLSFAQDFQGKAIYSASNKMELTLEGMDPAMQKRVQEMLAKQQKKEFIHPQ